MSLVEFVINDPASLIFVLVHLTGLDAAGGAHGDSDSISSLVAAVTNAGGIGVLGRLKSVRPVH